MGEITREKGLPVILEAYRQGCCLGILGTDPISTPTPSDPARGGCDLWWCWVAFRNIQESQVFATFELIAVYRLLGQDLLEWWYKLEDTTTVTKQNPMLGAQCPQQLWPPLGALGPRERMPDVLALPLLWAVVTLPVTSCTLSWLGWKSSVIVWYVCEWMHAVSASPSHRWNSGECTALTMCRCLG